METDTSKMECLMVMGVKNARNMTEECGVHVYPIPGHLTSDLEGSEWGVCECLASGHQGDPEIEAGCWQTQH